MTEAEGLGQITIEPDLDEYERGAVVTITARPLEDYEFSFWSGDKPSLLNPDTLIMNDDRHVIANFSRVTGIGKHLQKNAIRFYPNPVEDKVYVTIQAISGRNWDLMLVDPQGREIITLERFTTVSDQEELSYNFSDLRAGVYFLRLKSEKDGTFSDSIRLLKL